MPAVGRLKKQPGKPRNDLSTRLKGGVFTVAGLGLTIGGCAWCLSTANFIRSASQAPGIVTRLNAGGSHPEISFTAASGQVVDYPQGGMIWGYRTGQPVSILYNPRDPSDSPCLNTIPALWFFQGMTLLLGLIFSSTGLYLAFGPKEET